MENENINKKIESSIEVKIKKDHYNDNKGIIGDQYKNNNSANTTHLNIYNNDILNYNWFLLYKFLISAKNSKEDIMSRIQIKLKQHTDTNHIYNNIKEYSFFDKVKNQIIRNNNQDTDQLILFKEYLKYLLIEKINQNKINDGTQIETFMLLDIFKRKNEGILKNCDSDISFLQLFLNIILINLNEDIFIFNKKKNNSYIRKKGISRFNKTINKLSRGRDNDMYFSLNNIDKQPNKQIKHILKIDEQHVNQVNEFYNTLFLEYKINTKAAPYCYFLKEENNNIIDPLNNKFNEKLEASLFLVLNITYYITYILLSNSHYIAYNNIISTAPSSISSILNNTCIKNNDNKGDELFSHDILNKQLLIIYNTLFNFLKGINYSLKQNNKYMFETILEIAILLESLVIQTKLKTNFDLINIKLFSQVNFFKPAIIVLNQNPKLTSISILLSQITTKSLGNILSTVFLFDHSGINYETSSKLLKNLLTNQPSYLNKSELINNINIKDEDYSICYRRITYYKKLLYSLLYKILYLKDKRYNDLENLVVTIFNELCFKRRDDNEFNMILYYVIFQEIYQKFGFKINLIINKYTSEDNEVINLNISKNSVSNNNRGNTLINDKYYLKLNIVPIEGARSLYNQTDFVSKLDKYVFTLLDKISLSFLLKNNFYLLFKIEPQLRNSLYFIYTKLDYLCLVYESNKTEKKQKTNTVNNFIILRNLILEVLLNTGSMSDFIKRLFLNYTSLSLFTKLSDFYTIALFDNSKQILIDNSQYKSSINFENDKTSTDFVLLIDTIRSLNELTFKNKIPKKKKNDFLNGHQLINMLYDNIREYESHQESNQINRNNINNKINTFLFVHPIKQLLNTINEINVNCNNITNKYLTYLMSSKELILNIIQTILEDFATYIKQLTPRNIEVSRDINSNLPYKALNSTLLMFSPNNLIFDDKDKEELLNKSQYIVEFLHYSLRISFIKELFNIIIDNFDILQEVKKVSMIKFCLEYILVYLDNKQSNDVDDKIEIEANKEDTNSNYDCLFSNDNLSIIIELLKIVSNINNNCNSDKNIIDISLTIFNDDVKNNKNNIEFLEDSNISKTEFEEIIISEISKIKNHDSYYLVEASTKELFETYSLYYQKHKSNNTILNGKQISTSSRINYLSELSENIKTQIKEIILLKKKRKNIIDVYFNISELNRLLSKVILLVNDINKADYDENTCIFPNSIIEEIFLIVVEYLNSNDSYLNNIILKSLMFLFDLSYLNNKVKRYLRNKSIKLNDSISIDTCEINNKSSNFLLNNIFILIKNNIDKSNKQFSNRNSNITNNKSKNTKKAGSNTKKQFTNSSEQHNYPNAFSFINDTSNIDSMNPYLQINIKLFELIDLIITKYNEVLINEDSSTLILEFLYNNILSNSLITIENNSSLIIMSSISIVSKLFEKNNNSFIKDSYKIINYCINTLKLNVNNKKSHYISNEIINNKRATAYLIFTLISNKDFSLISGYESICASIYDTIINTRNNSYLHNEDKVLVLYLDMIIRLIKENILGFYNEILKENDDEIVYSNNKDIILNINKEIQYKTKKNEDINIKIINDGISINKPNMDLLSVLKQKLFQADKDKDEIDNNVEQRIRDYLNNKSSSISSKSKNINKIN